MHDSKLNFIWWLFADDSDEDDDAAYYKEEVGQAPDPGNVIVT